jgi:hypothetical protein
MDAKAPKRDCIVPNTDENEVWLIYAANDALSTDAKRYPVTAAKEGQRRIVLYTLKRG